MLPHTLFDILAALASFGMTIFVYRWRLRAEGDRIGAAGFGYALALVAGAGIGAYVFGTLNLLLSSHAGIGRSILGAYAGAVTTIEIYKWRKGISGSTGIVFVPAFATSVVIGRIGCFFAGLEDFTYGVATGWPTGVDFGDHVLRHPVQLYESAAMAAFLLFALVSLARRSPFFLRNGFYLMTAWYAAERFWLEFLKPYGAVFGPFNIFHLLCAALFAYSIRMIARNWHGHELPA